MYVLKKDDAFENCIRGSYPNGTRSETVFYYNSDKDKLNDTLYARLSNDEDFSIAS